jgi:hypothetical protein
MITVTLSDVNDYTKQISYTITPYDNPLAKDWVRTLEEDCIKPNLEIRKNFNFMGLPNTYRNFDYLCNILNKAIEKINDYNPVWIANGLKPYIIKERYSEEFVVLPDGSMNHTTLNFLHNHFEVLRGTVWNPSPYTTFATPEMILEIENLNFCCHELESLIWATSNFKKDPGIVRPSTIVSFHNIKLLDLKEEHRQLVLENAFDREFGGVYMHWSQIGKRLDEVFQDENAPDLVIGDDPTDITTAGTQCEAINSLRYYCGGFDIDWGRDMTRKCDRYWDQWTKNLFAWVEKNGLDPLDTRLVLGCLPIGKVNIKESFGTIDPLEVWKIISQYMNIYSIEINGHVAVYN